jgi:G3E family GTPase
MSSYTYDDDKDEDEDDDDDDDEAPLLVSLVEEDPTGGVPPAATTSSSPQHHPPSTSSSTSLEPPPSCCPVTILSGALGSGKTTLIRYILQSPHHHKRIAVIENEFGDGLAIESLIATNGVDNSSLSQFIELPNGCVCCTVKDSLVSTLEQLMTKCPDLDYILIEASGMANPGPIAAIFWLDDALESRLQLDGVVTLVDVVHLSRQLRHVPDEAWQQIAFADRILLNKMDLLLLNSEKKDDDDKDNATRLLAQVEATVRHINPTAQLQTTTYSQVPNLDFILNANCYHHQDQKLFRNPQDKELWWNQTVQQQQQQQQQHHHDDDHHHHTTHDHDHDTTNCVTCQQQQQFEEQHTHTANVTTVAFCEPGSMNRVKLHAWLASILWPHQDEHDQILRARLEEQQSHEKEQQPPPSHEKEQPPRDDDDEDDPEEEQQQQPKEQQIYRIKGVVSLQCHVDQMEDDELEWIRYCDPTTGIDKRQYIVQAVYDTWDISPTQEEFGATEDDHPRECKLVIIGRHLDRDELIQGLQSCMI